MLLNDPTIINIIIFKTNTIVVSISQTPSPQTESDTRLIFKQSTASLNSVFLLLDCLKNAQDPYPTLPYYLPLTLRKKRWLYTFLKGMK